MKTIVKCLLCLMLASCARSNFVGPQGPKGDTGASGAQGIQGAAGANGHSSLVSTVVVYETGCKKAIAVNSYLDVNDNLMIDKHDILIESNIVCLVAKDDGKDD